MGGGVLALSERLEVHVCALSESTQTMSPTSAQQTHSSSTSRPRGLGGHLFARLLTQARRRVFTQFKYRRYCIHIL